MNKVTLTDDEMDAVVEAIYRGRVRSCEATIEGWDEDERDSLLCRVLRGESERFVSDAIPAVESIVAARIAEALRDASKRLDKQRNECKATNQGTCHEADQIRLDWIADEYSPPD